MLIQGVHQVCEESYQLHSVVALDVTVQLSFLVIPFDAEVKDAFLCREYLL